MYNKLLNFFPSVYIAKHISLSIACRINLQQNVIFKVGFFSHEYRLTRIPYTVLSSQNQLVGSPLDLIGVPISFLFSLK